MSDLFVNCEQPLSVSSSRGSVSVPCGKCVPCQQNRSLRIRRMIDFETKNTTYCELINLTYSDEFLPYLDLSVLCDKPDVSLSDDFALRTELPLHLGRRMVKHDRSDKLRLASDAANPPIIRFEQLVPFLDDSFDYTMLMEEILEYNARIDKYYKLYPNRKRGRSRMPFMLPILYKNDIQRFLKRLRFYIDANFGCKVRYFAVGEYGTHALRPHWHLLLFHDSAKLRAAFRDTHELSTSSSVNPQECADFLFNSSIWQFGIVTTTVTDGHIGSYLSGYFNQSSSLPRLLNKFPQRCFKSAHFGCGFDSQTRNDQFYNDDFQGLTSDTLVDKQGRSSVVSVPSSYYSKFLVGLPSSLPKTFTSYHSVVCSAKYYLAKIARKVAGEVNVFSDVFVYKSYLYLRSIHMDALSSFSRDKIKPLYDYVHNCVSYSVSGSLNGLSRLFQSVQRISRVSDLFSLSVSMFIRKSMRLSSFLKNLSLCKFFELLTDASYSKVYYGSFLSGSSVPAFSLYKDTSIYKTALMASYQRYFSSIKHREVVELYKHIN